MMIAILVSYFVWFLIGAFVMAWLNHKAGLEPLKDPIAQTILIHCWPGACRRRVAYC